MQEPWSEISVYIVCGCFAYLIVQFVRRYQQRLHLIQWILANDERCIWTGLLLASPVFILLLIQDKMQGAHVWTLPEGALYMTVMTLAMLGCVLGLLPIVKRARRDF